MTEPVTEETVITPRRRANSGAVRRALGTVVKLVVASLVVGFLLAVLGVDPITMWSDLWRGAVEAVRGTFGFAVSNVGAAFALLITGAIVVLPIWLVKRLLSGRR